MVHSKSTYRNKNFLSLFYDLIKKSIPRLELHKILCQGITNEQHLSSVREIIRNDSLFSESKVIVFFDTQKLKAKHLQTIGQDLSLNSNCITILFTESELPKTGLQSLPTHSIVEVPILIGAKLERWIQNEALKNDTKGCDPDATRYLSKELGGEKIDQIASTITKAALITQNDQSISLRNILACSHVKFDRDVFALFDAVARKDRLHVATCIESILDSGNHPLQIFSYFSKSIKTIIAQKCKSAGAEYAKDLHNQWVYNKLNPRMFDHSRLDSALKKLAALEFALKDNGVDHEVALKHTLNQL